MLDHPGSLGDGWKNLENRIFPSASTINSTSRLKSPVQIESVPLGTFSITTGDWRSGLREPKIGEVAGDGGQTGTSLIIDSLIHAACQLETLAGKYA